MVGVPHGRRCSRRGGHGAPGVGTLRQRPRPGAWGLRRHPRAWAGTPPGRGPRPERERGLGGAPRPRAPAVGSAPSGRAPASPPLRPSWRRNGVGMTGTVTRDPGRLGPGGAGRGQSLELRYAFRGSFWSRSFLETPFPHSCYEDPFGLIARPDPAPSAILQRRRFVSMKTGDRKGSSEHPRFPGTRGEGCRPEITRRCR